MRLIALFAALLGFNVTLTAAARCEGVSDDTWFVDKTAFNVVLRRCKIMEVIANPPLNMSSAMTIDLSDNYITKLRGNVLKRFKNLKRFNVSNNRIAKMSSNIFDNLTSMERVDLDNNFLDFDEIRNLFGQRVSVDHLSISKNNQALYSNYWEPSTTRFILDHSFGLKDAKSVTLSDNSLVVVTKAAFMRLTSLEGVNLSKNKIKFIDQDTFSKNVKLKTLIMDHNQLFDIHAMAFVGNPSLEIISLSHNNFSTFDCDRFRTNNELKYLMLSFNRIKSLNNLNFHLVPNLVAITLRNNEIREIPSELFSSNPHLDQLSLADNDIENLPNVIFNKSSKLSIFLLNGNRLKTIQGEIFSNNTNLITFSLANNNMKNIKNIALAKSIENLDLSRNELTSIELDTIKHLENLQQLDLSANCLKTVPADIFKVLPKLSILYLDRNHIQTLPSALFKTTDISSTKRIIALNMNPLKCECINEQIKSTHNLRVVFQYRDGPTGPYCIHDQETCIDSIINMDLLIEWEDTNRLVSIPKYNYIEFNLHGFYKVDF